MTGVQVVEGIVDILVAGLTKFATGIGSGVSAFVQNLWFTGTGESTQFSVYAILILSFAGISLVIGLSTLLFHWLQNLGR